MEILYEEDLERGNSHPEQRVPGQPDTEAVEQSALKRPWGFGKKNISDDHHGLNTTEVLSHIFQEPRKSLHACRVLGNSGRGP